MSTPLVIDVPHRLTADEVKRRLSSRIGELPGHIPGGVAHVTSSWESDDRMDLSVTALGQTIAATLDVRPAAVRVSVVLPPMLSFMGGAISAAIKGKGGQLLLGDGGSA